MPEARRLQGKKNANPASAHRGPGLAFLNMFIHVRTDGEGGLRNTRPRDRHDVQGSSKHGAAGELVGECLI